MKATCKNSRNISSFISMLLLLFLTIISSLAKPASLEKNNDLHVKIKALLGDSDLETESKISSIDVVCYSKCSGNFNGCIGLGNEFDALLVCKQSREICVHRCTTRRRKEKKN